MPALRRRCSFRGCLIWAMLWGRDTLPAIIARRRFCRYRFSMILSRRCCHYQRHQADIAAAANIRSLPPDALFFLPRLEETTAAASTALAIKGPDLVEGVTPPNEPRRPPHYLPLAAASPPLPGLLRHNLRSRRDTAPLCLTVLSTATLTITRGMARSRRSAPGRRRWRIDVAAMPTGDVYFTRAPPILSSEMPHAYYECCETLGARRRSLTAGFMPIADFRWLRRRPCRRSRLIS